MNTSRQKSKNEVLRDIMHRTTPEFQRRLAVAYHLKTVGGQPAMIEQFSPMEQEAGEWLALTKYPLSPEAEAQLKAHALAPPEESSELSQSEIEQIQAADEDSRESFPNLTPRSRRQAPLSNIIPPKIEIQQPFASHAKTPKLSGTEMKVSLRGKNPQKRTLRIGGLFALTLTFLALGYGLKSVMFPSYTGIMSGLKGTRSGALLDLDGKYPNQRMTVWVTKEACAQIYGRWPAIGAQVKVLGPVTEFRGRPEIVVKSSSQLLWTTQLPTAPSTDAGATAADGISSPQDDAPSEDNDQSGVVFNINQIGWLAAVCFVFMCVVTIIIGVSNRGSVSAESEPTG